MSPRTPAAAMLAALLLAAGAALAQEPKADPPAKVKGILPMNWGKIGLSDEQKQDIYKLQAKYGGEIDKLEAKIRELKSKRDAEMKGVLTPEQKKRLEDILLGKDK